MPSFGSTSQARLDTCHPHLLKVFNRVVQFHDCAVLEGHRSKTRQDEAFESGASKVEFPNSKHNVSPSNAADVAPYFSSRGGVVWPNKNTRPETYTKDLAQFYYFAGIVIGTARDMGIELRWGGDWDRDHDILDQRFDDLVHFERIL